MREFRAEDRMSGALNWGVGMGGEEVGGRMDGCGGEDDDGDRDREDGSPGLALSTLGPVRISLGAFIREEMQGPWQTRVRFQSGHDEAGEA